MKRCKAIFGQLRKHAAKHWPVGDARIAEGSLHDFPHARDFAYCQSEPLIITVSPLLDRQPWGRIQGILRHEFGHAILFRTGFHAHTERQADAVASAVFGAPIRYDSANVQSITHGKPVRPKTLG